MNFLNKNEKYLLALFFKRLTFDDAYRASDADTHENQKAMAYRILDVVEKVQKELAYQGYAPR
ncbi:MAG: hypothetical protein FWD78_03000 [Treponema sp.]|nr:hypothetical protein [Treponema sp.]